MHGRGAVSSLSERRDTGSVHCPEGTAPNLRRQREGAIRPGGAIQYLPYYILT